MNDIVDNAIDAAIRSIQDAIGQPDGDFGIDPVHFGMIMVVNLALGMITPPFGVNLFASGLHSYSGV